MAYSNDVRDFTLKTFEAPNIPSPMNKAEVEFIIRMVMSELGELAQTVMPYEVVNEFLINCVHNMDSRELPQGSTEDAIIADQADALVDAIYYMENAAVKKGINLSKVFAVVHAANMDKFRNGVIKRADGKIMKPADWKEPDIVAEITCQKKYGAF